jgi:ubiquitin-conjugating enzyme E2 S
MCIRACLIRTPQSKTSQCTLENAAKQHKTAPRHFFPVGPFHSPFASARRSPCLRLLPAWCVCLHDRQHHARRLHCRLLRRLVPLTVHSPPSNPRNRLLPPATQSTPFLPPQTAQRVARELRKLATTPLDGIRYVGDLETLAEVRAELRGPAGTPYEGGRFVVQLTLGAGFPAQPPRGVFLTKIFHPNVAPGSGEICVNTLKRDWSPDLGLAHVLQVIRCLLIVPFPESSLNDEAGRLFMDSYDEYARRARLWTDIHAQKRLAGDEDDAQDVDKPTTKKKEDPSDPASASGGEQENASPAKNAAGKAVRGGTPTPGIKRAADAMASPVGQSPSAAKRKAADKKKKSLRRL